MRQAKINLTTSLLLCVFGMDFYLFFDIFYDNLHILVDNLTVKCYIQIVNDLLIKSKYIKD